MIVSLYRLIILLGDIYSLRMISIPEHQLEIPLPFMGELVQRKALCQLEIPLSKFIQVQAIEAFHLSILVLLLPVEALGGSQ